MKNRKAKEEDFNELLNIRIKTMKPSLENIGRFDETRATERFRISFISEFTTVVTEEDKIIGFYMITERNYELFVNHLYIDLPYQSKGIGSNILNEIKEYASQNGKEIKLEALKESESNSFYMKNGFIKVGEYEFDNVYSWKEKEGLRG